MGKFFPAKEKTKTKQLNLTNILVYFCILILQYINHPHPLPPTPFALITPFNLLYSVASRHIMYVCPYKEKKAFLS